jgi:hypothetical protein
MIDIMGDGHIYGQAFWVGPRRWRFRLASYGVFVREFGVCKAIRHVDLDVEM